MKLTRKHGRLSKSRWWNLTALGGGAWLYVTKGQINVGVRKGARTVVLWWCAGEGVGIN